MTATTHPALASLREKANGPLDALTAAVIEALIDAQELERLDDLFVFTIRWDGIEPELTDKIQHELHDWEYVFALRRLSAQQIELKLALSIDSNGILDQRVLLEPGNPIIIGAPEKGKGLFMMILATSDNMATKPAAVEREYLERIPKPIHQVSPAYPDELRRQGVKGEVGLRVAIDEEGTVLGVTVEKSLHPYLDYAAVQALKRWKFEPLLRDGKPVATVTTLRIAFDPESYLLRTADSEKNVEGNKELRSLLDRCAEYGRRLAAAAMDFICEEKIKETNYDYMTGEEIKKDWIPAYLVIIPRDGTPNPPITKILTHYRTRLSPKQTIRNEFICDYQLIKKADKVTERRIVLKENGRTLPDKNKLLEGKRYSVLQPFFAFVRLFEADRQSQYSYRLIDEENIRGKRAYVIEVMPKPGLEGDVHYAKIWIDKNSYQVRKSEIEGVPVEGYEDILKEASLLNVKPVFNIKYSFQVEKNGVLFPSETEIQASYPRSRNIADEDYSPHLKLRMNLTYQKYKFFTVQTDSQIIK